MKADVLKIKFEGVIMKLTKTKFGKKIRNQSRHAVIILGHVLKDTLIFLEVRIRAVERRNGGAAG